MINNEYLNQAINFLYNYCDGGTNCDNCFIKNKIHCHKVKLNTGDEVYDSLLVQHDMCPAPYTWSELN